MLTGIRVRRVRVRVAGWGEHATVHATSTSGSARQAANGLGSLYIHVHGVLHNSTVLGLNCAGVFAHLVRVRMLLLGTVVLVYTLCLRLGAVPTMSDATYWTQYVHS